MPNGWRHIDFWNRFPEPIVQNRSILSAILEPPILDWYVTAVNFYVYGTTYQNVHAPTSRFHFGASCWGSKSSDKTFNRSRHSAMTCCWLLWLLPSCLFCWTAQKACHWSDVVEFDESLFLLLILVVDSRRWFSSIVLVVHSRHLFSLFILVVHYCRSFSSCFWLAILFSCCWRCVSVTWPIKMQLQPLAVNFCLCLRFRSGTISCRIGSRRF